LHSPQQALLACTAERRVSLSLFIQQVASLTLPFLASFVLQILDSHCTPSGMPVLE
jgi:hypothetical protein